MSLGRVRAGSRVTKKYHGFFPTSTALYPRKKDHHPECVIMIFHPGRAGICTHSSHKDLQEVKGPMIVEILLLIGLIETPLCLTGALGFGITAVIGGILALNS
jgi:hypothetical protein